MSTSNSTKISKIVNLAKMYCFGLQKSKFNESQHQLVLTTSDEAYVETINSMAKNYGCELLFKPRNKLYKDKKSWVLYVKVVDEELLEGLGELVLPNEIQVGVHMTGVYSINGKKYLSLRAVSFSD